jgi:hypothetical protein
MKISADQIAEKEIAGKTKDGRPVVYIATNGGLHAFFCKDEEGNTCSIGAAPHKGIAKFLAGKKEDITWNSAFSKSEATLEKSEEALFQKLRKVMFMPCVMLGEIEPAKSDTFVLYHVNKQAIEVVSKSEIEEDIKNGEVDRFDLIRDVSITSPAICIQDHPQFLNSFGGTHE